MERRDTQLLHEYRRNPLYNLDSKYHGTQPDQVGSMVRRLDGYGKLFCLVMGTFLEGSKDMHSLLYIIAESKLKTRGLASQE